MLKEEGSTLEPFGGPLRSSYRVNFVPESCLRIAIILRLLLKLKSYRSSWKLRLVPPPKGVGRYCTRTLILRADPANFGVGARNTHVQVPYVLL